MATAIFFNTLKNDQCRYAHIIQHVKKSLYEGLRASAQSRICFFLKSQIQIFPHITPSSFSLCTHSSSAPPPRCSSHPTPHTHTLHHHHKLRISRHSPHTTHLTPLISHPSRGMSRQSSHTIHLTPLITHDSAHTTHLSISHHSPLFEWQLVRATWLYGFILQDVNCFYSSYTNWSMRPGHMGSSG